MSLLFFLLNANGEVDRTARAEIRYAMHRAPGAPQLIPNDADVPILRRVWDFTTTILAPSEARVLAEELKNLLPRFRDASADDGDDAEDVMRLCHRAVAESRSMLVGAP